MVVDSDDDDGEWVEPISSVVLPVRGGSSSGSQQAAAPAPDQPSSAVARAEGGEAGEPAGAVPPETIRAVIEELRRLGHLPSESEVPAEQEVRSNLSAEEDRLRPATSPSIPALVAPALPELRGDRWFWSDWSRNQPVARPGNRWYAVWSVPGASAALLGVHGGPRSWEGLCRLIPGRQFRPRVDGVRRCRSESEARGLYLSQVEVNARPEDRWHVVWWA